MVYNLLNINKYVLGLSVIYIKDKLKIKIYYIML